MSICIAALGGAAAWPLAARAQQRVLPVIGYLSGRRPDSDAPMLVSVRRGLGDVGYAEGRNVAIPYRFADGRYDRLSAIVHWNIWFISAFAGSDLRLRPRAGPAKLRATEGARLTWFRRRALLSTRPHGEKAST
jgi:hypothetical protein